jgi:hypothetical protein
VTFPVHPEPFPVRPEACRQAAVDPEHPELVRPVVAPARLVARQQVVPAPDSLARLRLEVRPVVAAVVGQGAAAAVEQTQSTR